MNTSENEVVRKIVSSARQGKHASGLRLGAGDDAALFVPRRGYETILTTDWFVEGTHFLCGVHPPEAVGWKCLARAVSDIAAMGGKPRCFLLSLALPGALTGSWLTNFVRGLKRAANRFSCQLAGGDTTSRREVLINITVIGEVQPGQAVLRSGARVGDGIYVTGRLGEAEWGLRVLTKRGGRSANHKSAMRKHLYPEPRLRVGQWLARSRLATAMMDLSDGLSTDLPRLCSASKVGAVIESLRIPAVRANRSSAAEKADALTLAQNGGDDYELLFTVPRSKIRLIPPRFGGIPLTQIGEITRGRKLTLIGPDGRAQALKAEGWDPFRSHDWCTSDADGHAIPIAKICERY